MTDTITKINSVKADIERIRAVLAQQREDRAAILDAIAYAERAAQAAAEAHAQALAGRALGEAGDAAVADARAALKDATTMLAQARSREAHAEDLRLAIQCLEHRLVSEAAALAPLREQHDLELAQAARDRRHAAGLAYVEKAQELARAFAEVLAADHFVVRDLGAGEPIISLTDEVLLPSIAGIQANRPNLMAMVLSARMQLIEQHKAARL